jgi:hypothetical protein
MNFFALGSGAQMLVSFCLVAWAMLANLFSPLQLFYS